MTARRLTTAATLTGLVVVLCVMALWGYRAATAPLPGSSSGSASKGPTCSPDQQKVTRYIRRGDVTVSVFNAGRRPGRAQATMALLEQAGFKPGAVNNAPDGVKVARVEVYSTKADDPAAALVARAFGEGTQVVHTEDDLGPGVDVVIGDRFNKLDPQAPRRLKLATPETTCP